MKILQIGLQNHREQTNREEQVGFRSDYNTPAVGRKDSISEKNYNFVHLLQVCF